MDNDPIENESSKESHNYVSLLSSQKPIIVDSVFITNVQIPQFTDRPKPKVPKTKCFLFSDQQDVNYPP